MTRHVQGPIAHASTPLPRRLRPLERAFYARSVLVVARDLLGHLLVYETLAGPLVGRIVETEAYRGADDPASHAYRLTPRSRIMAGLPGFAYVYFTYGNHYCMNVVAERDGKAAAVLLRALEPVQGVNLMTRRRGIALRGPADLRLIASGPGRLAQAMGITREQYGWDLTRPPLYIADGGPGRRRIAITSRIGIRRAVDRPWRFYLRDNPYVSRHPGRGATRSAGPRWGADSPPARRDRPRRSPRPGRRN